MPDLPAAAATLTPGGGGGGSGSSSGAAAAAAPPRPAPARTQPTPAPPARKLRLLALHGYGQTAEVLRSRAGSYRKGLKARAEFVFLDAPFPAPGEVGGLSWWTWEGGPGDAATRPSRSDRPIAGWATSRAAILGALAAHAPVDGLLGFSQGAAAAAWAVSDLASGAAALPPGVPALRCVVLAAGFIPRDAVAAAAFEAAAAGAGSAAVAAGAAHPAPLRLPPVLLIAGESDEAVAAARTEEVARSWGVGDGASWLRHPGGHCLPTCSGGVKAAVGAFLDGL